ncbi:DUF4097 domain-containing protein [Allokutzneria sp. A3M-2-11 16]|uniref:DUF4097 family beta strand repeat-containing protein n=1 Tax=Allokutzneria sp. A3M-2-11 16 TaxID=2962043 RepID=UPI0020B7D790|nr:DUF4097 family beta strand repeat-containing protein [Allokutzneria sp. A3M-2-11 16]MCP3798423.1 DUF4097 domain-containing protein [Allokutzneria sp. A3M-2-11 16]
MSAFATPGPVAATVEVAGAQVRIAASDRTDTVVLVEPIDATNRSDVKVADRTKVEFTGGKLSVKTTVSGSKNGSVAITIELPSGSSLAAYLAHSAVRADGALGACELHMASGQVQLDSVDALRANVSSGEVAIGRIAGRADVDGGAFAMRIGEVGGAVKLSNSGGQVWIGHASADLDLSSAGCDFAIDRADGDVTAGTATGAIRIGRMTAGQAKLTNGSGNIEVGVSEGAAASVDVRSERGAVHDFVSPQGNPTSAERKVMVHARTRHGDVVIQRAAC